MVQVKIVLNGRGDATGGGDFFFIGIAVVVAFILAGVVGAGVGLSACGGPGWLPPGAQALFVVLAAAVAALGVGRTRRSSRSAVASAFIASWFALSCVVLTGLWLGEGVTSTFIYPDGPSSVPDAAHRFMTWLAYGPC